MSILGKIFNSGAKDLVDSVGNAIDKIHTSAEEKELIKHEINKAIYEFEKSMQAEVTKRWEADMKSDNWLSKNIRPLICVFLTAMFVVISIFDGNVGGFSVAPAYIPIYQTLLITVYGAYFAGRSIEKIKKK